MGTTTEYKPKNLTREEGLILKEALYRVFTICKICQTVFETDGSKWCSQECAYGDGLGINKPCTLSWDGKTE